MDIHEACEYCLRGESLDAAEIMAAIEANPSLLRARHVATRESILDLAVSTGNLDLVRALLRAGADPNAFQVPIDIPLIQAIRSRTPNRVKMVELLIQHGADVNAAGVLDGSALHAAVGESSNDLVDLLLRSGADVNIRAPVDGETPLWTACLLGNIELAQTLLANGADPSLRDRTAGSAPLDLAIQNDDVALAAVLLKAGADPSQRCPGGEAPLTRAILSNTKNSVDIVSLLLEHGADVNGGGHDVASPLHAAVMASRIDLVQLLLDNGADVNKQSHCTGLTPIRTAMMSGNTAVAQLLAKHGAQ